MWKKSKGYTLIELLVTATIAMFPCMMLLKVIGIPVAYSEGERTGVVTKVSKKGAFCKTWEAELNLGGLTTNSEGQTVANVWRFSVKDPAAVEQVSKAAKLNAPVTINYEQMVVVPIRDGETNYLATSVEFQNTAEKP